MFCLFILRKILDEEEQINFPFVETASGNLKIVPQQVVYESNQLSIVAANPRRTKVNVKADQKDMSRTPPNIQPQMWRGLNRNREGDGDRESDGSSGSDKNGQKTHISKLSSELSLAKLGFYQNDPINWENAQVPEKSDLYKILEYRITNYICPDILIKIGNHEYRCHLLVLQCYSGYFLDKPKGRLEISEKLVSKTAFTYIYDWMLHKGPKSYQLLNRENILEIFMASQCLQVKELEEQCWAFIECHELFNEDRAFALYLDARAANNTIVMELMVPRVQRFFLTLVSSKEFLELSLPEVKIFLSSNFICVRAEMEVFMSAVRWLLCDWGKRQKHAPDVMSCVRFGLIDPKDLVDIQRNKENREYQLVIDHPLIGAMLEEGLAYAIVKNWNMETSSNDDYANENLGLNPPAQRNWAGNKCGKNVIKSYEEFLQELHKYRQIHMKAMAVARENVVGHSERSDVGTASDYSSCPPRYN